MAAITLNQLNRLIVCQEKVNIIMPFKSKAQEKWAFANGKSFAEAWAKITDQKSLPEKVSKKKKKSSSEPKK